MFASVTPVLQGLALLLISLVVGSMFGIWRGYDPATYSAATFVEVHQGAVRGLNILLPILGLATILTVAALAVLARDQPVALGLYLAAAALLIVAGAITRFGNQPINELVMHWSVTALPDNWLAVRDSWWSWHLGRLAAGLAAELLLLVAVLGPRAG